MPEPTVLDPASGSRMFYFDKDDERVLFGDMRTMEPTVFSNGQTVEVRPDTLMDFRALPFEDDRFHLVIFDPPHLDNAGPESWMRAKYGFLGSSWRDDLRAGFAECFRVLRPLGTLIFKWSEVRIPVADVLALTPERPLIGHRSGRNMKTHWIAFMKAESPDSSQQDRGAGD
ncbi:class I SAM-dependent methyltransferase [Microbacterium sp.]|uniref:class I SAM-dependent methyltransferase n=1 Tax=Actinomycetes TaxID=1760 RepID=UPI0037C7DDEC